MISHVNLIREHPRRTRRRFTPLARATSVILAALAVSPAAVAHGLDTIVLTEVYRQQIVDTRSGSNQVTGTFLLHRDRMLVETSDKSLLLCDTLDGRVLWTQDLRELVTEGTELYEGHVSSLVAARYIGDGSIQIVIRCKGGGEVIGFGPTTEQPMRAELGSTPGTDCDLFPIRDSQMLLPKFGALRDRLYVFDLDKMREVRELEMPRRKRPITSVTYSPDGRYCAATGDSVWVWETESGRRLNDAYQPAKEVINEWLRRSSGYGPECSAFSANNELLVVGTGTDKLLFFDVMSARLLRLVEDGPVDWNWGYPVDVSFLGDTKNVLVNGGTLAIYDFDRSEWFPARTALDATEGVMGPVHVFDDAIIFCDYAGRLRRYRWTVQQAPAGPPSADPTTQPSED